MTERKLSRFAALIGFVVVATFVAGKTARDATLLATYAVHWLPTFVGISAALTIPMVLGVSRLTTVRGPAAVYAQINVLSAAALVVEWLALAHWTHTTSAVVYFHLAAVGPVLVSGFWSTINEQFDVRGEKRHIGKVGLGTTLGGIAGGLVAQLVAATLPASAILLVVAMLQLGSGVLLAAIGGGRRGARLARAATAPGTGGTLGSLGGHGTRDPGEPADTVDAAGPGTPVASAAGLLDGARVIVRSRLLRNVAGLVILGAMGAAALDYVFKADIARSAAGSPLKALALYYTLTSVLTALVQLVATERTIARLGVGGSAVALPATVAGLAGAMLLVPSSIVTAIARGAELVVRSSIFRAGYELLFAPLPPAAKRPAKVVLDVGAERIGDILGSQLIFALVFLIPSPRTAIVVAALVIGAAAVALAFRIPRAYSRALERTLLATGNSEPFELVDPAELAREVPQAPGAHSEDRLAARVGELRSNDPGRAEAALAEPLVPELVPHVVPLLASHALAPGAAARLREVAPHATGGLIDALFDPALPPAVRHQLPAILEHGDPDLAAFGLWRALSLDNFDLRFRAAKSLAHLRDAGRALAITNDQVFDAVVREVDAGAELWSSALALDHVFTILGLALPPAPLHVALHAVSAGDTALRGTALEYLETVLPARVRSRLLPLLEREVATATALAS